MNLAQPPLSSNFKTPAPQTVNFKVKYKTEKCRYWEQQGACPFGEMCAFIHENFETRFKNDIHLRYKTKTCFNFSHQGYCKYGDRCLFLHYNEAPSAESMSFATPRNYQKNMEILSEFGFEIFEAEHKKLFRHMKKDSSRLAEMNFDDWCEGPEASTEPELMAPNELDECSSEEGQFYWQLHSQTVDLLLMDERKPRMYSL